MSPEPDGKYVLYEDIKHLLGQAGVDARLEPLGTVAIPFETLKVWSEAMHEHRSDDSDEAEWNNHGVVEVDDAIREILRHSVNEKT